MNAELPAESVALPAVFDDESGDVWYAAGHVDPRWFVLAVLGELIDMHVSTEGLRIKALVESVRHEWFKPSPDDEELWNVCQQGDEGAEAWTTVRL